MIDHKQTPSEQRITHRITKLREAEHMIRGIIAADGRFLSGHALQDLSTIAATLEMERNELERGRTK